ncbi:tetratricopeptide repeat protein [Aquimarina sp. 2-A2]|uniref:tetratricopeptide repeat protein n=1 Tax=Aquimarina sp. 2-A2 TaxID=3382644 RepID=UPI00387F05E0
MITIIKYILFTVPFVGSLYIPVAAQEIEPQQEVNVDDLGNVSDEFQELFFEALTQKGIENYEKAIDALEKCIAIDPQVEVLYFELGKNYLALKQYELAKVNFEKALEDKPNNRFILEQLFEVHFALHDYKASIEVVSQLVGFDTMYREQLVNLYFLDQRYDDALQTLDEVVAEYGEDQYRRTLRKRITLKLDNPITQIARLDNKIKEEPKNEQPYVNLIYLYSQANQNRKAFEVAKALLAQIPTSEVAHLALYKFYLDDNQTDLAVASMKIALQSSTMDSDSKYKVLNDFIIFVGRNPQFEKQLIEVTEAFSKTDSSGKIFNDIGNFYYEKGKRELALNYYERGLKDAVNDIGLIQRTLELQIELKRFEKAKFGSELALELYPTQPKIYLLNAQTLIALKAYDEAIETLETGLDYILDNVVIESQFYTMMSKAYQALGDASKAKEFEQKATQLQNKS